MKNIFIYVCCILWGIICCQSCYDDKGNYDYHDINEIEISGLDSIYTFRAGDLVTIKPIVDASIVKEGGDYTYEWVWQYAKYKDKTYNAYVWSDLKEWDNFNISLPSGRYKFYYRVKDNETDVTWMSKTFIINILDDISKGFCVLSEIDNTGRFDFVNFYKDTFDLRLDMLTNLGTELPSLENPIGIVCRYDNNSPYSGASSVSGENAYMVNILTQSGAYRLHPSTFTYEDKFNMTSSILMEQLLPPGFYVKDILYYTDGTAMMGLVDNNNNIYYGYETFGQAMTARVYTNTVSGKLLNISPKVLLSSSGLFAYDVDNQSFIKQTSANATASGYLAASKETEFVDGTDTLMFKYNNTGKELVYFHLRNFVTGITGNPIYAILRDPDTNEFFYGSFRHTDATQLAYYRFKDVPEIDNIVDFAMTYNSRRNHYANNFMYYRTDKEIYSFNLVNKATMLVYKTDDVISYFGFPKAGNWTDQMIVCTYDPNAPADSCGKMEVFKITAPNPGLTIAEYNGEKMVWTGFGKIIDVDWKDK